MKITCNGETKEITQDTTLMSFIRDMDLNPDTVVAECDGRIIKRDEYDTLLLAEGNLLELIRFVGGGMRC
ncbi:sulfur carrier protein ThiS [Thermodesulfobacteriota bacterium]